MTSQFRHIIVPLDFTRKNAAAIRVALDMAKQNNARVTLMHVVETIEYASDKAMLAFYDSLKERAERELSRRAKKFLAAGVPVEQEVLTGKTARCIVGFAMRKRADLVILSSHKIKLDKAPESWATLSYQVSIMCQCPVMLVK